MHCVAFEKAVYENLAPAHQEGLLFRNQKALPRYFFNEKAWWCSGEVGVDRLNSFVTTWWTGVGYLHIYIVQITTK